MEFEIRDLGNSGALASSTLLGHNLEMIFGVDTGLLTNRLRNAKFLGPVNSKTGLAPEWEPYPSYNFQGINFQLLDGVGLSGETAQVITNFCNSKHTGILQKNCRICKNEQLEVIFWARVQNCPVPLRIEIRPLDRNSTVYDSVLVTADSSYWKEYKIRLNSPCDDPECIFVCKIEGSGTVWFDQIYMKPFGSSIVNQKMIESIKQMNIPVLRFPGGCITTLYHWQYGTGDISLRPVKPDPVFKYYVPYDFGTDEYLEMCTKLGIIPHITVNISTGTPEEAGKWASYCAQWYSSRGIDAPLIYWQIGNEHYGSWEIGNMTGDMYVEVLKQFVPKIRENYPKTRIVAIGIEKSDGKMAGEKHPWRARVLEEATDFFDLLSFQWYQGNGWDIDKATRHRNALCGIDSAVDEIKGIIRDCKKYKLNKNIALTEWNLWYHASHYDGKNFNEPYDVQHGLFCAAMFHMFTRFVPDLELTNFYNLVNAMGVLKSDGIEVEETLLVSVFNLYRTAFDGYVRILEFNNTEGFEGLERPDVICLSNDKAVWMFLINQSTNEYMEVKLKDFGVLSEGITLKGNDLEGVFTKETFVKYSDVGVLSLPPISITRLEFIKE